MAQILYETDNGKEIFDSRTKLIKYLLKLKKYNKSTISVKADTTPQLVHGIYKKMVKREEIDDYYPEFIKKRKENRLNRHGRRR